MTEIASFTRWGFFISMRLPYAFQSDQKQVRWNLFTGVSFMLVRPHILEAIRGDHDRIRELFKLILMTTAGEKKRKELYGDLRREISRHSMFEEEMLYPQLKCNEQLQTLARVSIVQHATVDKLITRLDLISPQTKPWEHTFRDLYEQMRDHMRIEEVEILNKLEAPKPQAAPARTRVRASKAKGVAA